MYFLLIFCFVIWKRISETSYDGIIVFSVLDRHFFIIRHFALDTDHYPYQGLPDTDSAFYLSYRDFLFLSFNFKDES